MLDLDCGWGSLAIRAASKYGCFVTVLTTSIEQATRVKQRVQKADVASMVTILSPQVDARNLSRNSEYMGKFDCVICSSETITTKSSKSAWKTFFQTVGRVLKPDAGKLVLAAVTTPVPNNSRNFLNTILFPGLWIPTVWFLVHGAHDHAHLSLNHVDQLGLHFAQTLSLWRRRLNLESQNEARALRMDDVSLRAINYGLLVSQAALVTQQQHLQLLVFSNSKDSKPDAIPVLDTVMEPVMDQAAPLTDAALKALVPLA